MKNTSSQKKDGCTRESLQLRYTKRIFAVMCIILIVFMIFCTGSIYAFMKIQNTLERVDTALKKITDTDVKGIAETAFNINDSLAQLTAAMQNEDISKINKTLDSFDNIADIDFEELSSSIDSLREALEPITTVFNSIPPQNE